MEHLAVKIANLGSILLTILANSCQHLGLAAESVEFLELLDQTDKWISQVT